MDSSESISFSMDTTTDSIDVMGHFQAVPLKGGATSRDNDCRQSPRKQARMLLREHNNESYDRDEEEDLTHKEPPDKLLVVDETPPPSSSSSTSSSTSSTSSTSQSTASTTTSNSDCPVASMSQPIIVHHEVDITDGFKESNSNPSTPNKAKKSVLFDNVTVYHFCRSQGFTSIPSQGGSTLGMRQRHFLRRRLSVDLYETVRQRSRREILLKIRADKKRKEERARLAEQRKLNERLKIEGSSASSTSNTNTIFSDSDDNEQQQQGGDSNSDVDDDELYSEYSDISDSELEDDIESNIFLRPLDVKVRRNLLRQSGVGRIDPSERKECKRIRDSRDKSGCRCVGRCIPEYCECSRLGIKCHVDRQSFPCGCSSVGCRNPEGRTEFDISRVRNHFIEKVIKGESLSDSSNDTAVTGDSADTGVTEQVQTSPSPGFSGEIC